MVKKSKTGRHLNLSVAQRAALSARLKAMDRAPAAKARDRARLAAYRKSHPMALAQRKAAGNRLRAAAARRKALGIHVHGKASMMSPAARAKLSVALKAAAARRKASGIKIKHKSLTTAQHTALSIRMKNQALRRKALGLKRTTKVAKPKVTKPRKIRASHHGHASHSGRGRH